MPDTREIKILFPVNGDKNNGNTRSGTVPENSLIVLGLSGVKVLLWEGPLSTSESEKIWTPVPSQQSYDVKSRSTSSMTDLTQSGNVSAYYDFRHSRELPNQETNQNIKGRKAHNKISNREVRPFAAVEPQRHLKRPPGERSSCGSPPQYTQPEKRRRIFTVGEDFRHQNEKLERRAIRFAPPLDPTEVQANRTRMSSENKSLDEIIAENNVQQNRNPFSMTNQKSGFHDVTENSTNPGERNKLKAARRLPYQSRSFRPIVIDGCNVAYACGDVMVGRKTFDCLGIQICVDFFSRLGCTDITVVIPEAKLYDPSIVNGKVLTSLQQEGKLLTGCSKQLPNGKWISSYDDYLILHLARIKEGIVVSNDKFRDLLNKSAEWNNIISNNVVDFRFATNAFGNCEIYIPPDPYGRRGKNLQDMIRIPNRRNYFRMS